MRAFRVRYFHNVSARAGRSHVGRLGSFANGAATSRRHLSWASAIAAKFSRAAAFQQFTRESLVTLRALQRIFVRLRDRRETIPLPGAVARATGSPIAVDRPVRIRAAAEPFAHEMGRRVAFTPGWRWPARSGRTGALRQDPADAGGPRSKDTRDRHTGRAEARARGGPVDGAGSRNCAAHSPAGYVARRDARTREKTALTSRR
jgi:hypothetical protein